MFRCSCDQYHGDQIAFSGHPDNPGNDVGCDDLRDRLKDIKDRPQFHVFGHIHEGYGVTRDKKIDGITFINASTVDLRYRVNNKPIMFYVKGRGRKYSDRQSLWVDADGQENESKDGNQQNAAEKESGTEPKAKVEVEPEPEQKEDAVANETQDVDNNDPDSGGALRNIGNESNDIDIVNESQ